MLSNKLASFKIFIIETQSYSFSTICKLVSKLIFTVLLRTNLTIFLIISVFLLTNF
jgi:hypothetical protein